ncbi:acyl-CoA dehydrogenase domain-containing protein [Salinarchaeum sp. Harcht-Bsk1]|uniref:acyl-CoA dehydrogenase family protein n=1 Tax=Salinarchaeum sp. Harcht-Bsk1 TaxID=1333523 RepID=UPI000342381F|nr:acyl-CoA dehydrogenase family protein [Salinarchaeum sp. Harcht-Bsk1]AGN02426.1 acyl-CoA dehydrogenase domain-containing protein [Salinarchaeum sp. Harcht-Bsk1]
MDEGFDYGQFDRGRHMNYWTYDRTLQRELRRVYDAGEYEWAEPRLSEFGHLIGHTVADNADYIDDHGPELDTYDRFGEVQNFVRYPAEQFENEQAVYEAGIVADAFEAPPGRDEPMPISHYLGMLQLLSYAEGGGFGCPVAMTAGAALVLEKFDDGELEPYYDALVSRDYDDLIEGAMFLTEEQGGSDVGAIETTASDDEEVDCWRLAGEKWFCSNIDAEGTLALARTEDAPEGTAGLSMFLVPHGDPVGDPAAHIDADQDADAGGGPGGTSWQGDVLTKGARNDFDGAPPPEALNDQLYRRLKDKLGTIAVPTGEVEFDDTAAFLVGEEENGFKQMAEMLNLERLSNAAAACGVMGRSLLESKIRAADREAFGQPIDEYPLMREDLVDMAVDYEATTAFTHEAGRLLSERERAERAGEGDTDDAQHAYRLLRLLTPIAKLRTARMAIDTASYAMEIQGGNGYVNDFVTHRLLRDAQVLPIWEGTENVLSLDVLRALDREDAHEPLFDVMQRRLNAVSSDELADAAATVEAEYHDLAEALATVASEDEAYAQLSAKRLAHYVFEVFTAALLLEEADRALDDGDGRMALVARRFVDRELRDPDARGITSRDRFPIEHFEAIVQYESVAPERIDATGAVGESVD